MTTAPTSAYAFSALSIRGEPVELSRFAGQVSLIVNVASQCGFTPQYAGLEALQRQFRERGFTVLAFPCNQFRAQEPGSSDEIAQFCEMNFQTSFPIFSKICVNGPQTHPLYQHLKHAQPGVLGTTSVKWNFTKFLVDRQGRVVRRYATTTRPEAIAADIEAQL
jgi:glutathione peroxidase